MPKISRDSTCHIPMTSQVGHLLNVYPLLLNILQVTGDLNKEKRPMLTYARSYNPEDLRLLPLQKNPENLSGFRKKPLEF